MRIVEGGSATRPSLDFSRFTCLTFDCYGTLVDWETGILVALRPLLGSRGVSVSDTEVLQSFAQFEAQAEQGEYRTYREILREVVRAFGRKHGFIPSSDELDSLPESVKHWKPFPDTVPALRALGQKYRLAIISNVDDDLFARTARLLEVPFAEVITAQQARSYKPSLNNFRLALKRIGLPKEQILHVAQSLYHDVVPAKALGIATVWVNRRAGRSGSGATKSASAEADLEVPDLKTLAALVA